MLGLAGERSAGGSGAARAFRRALLAAGLSEVDERRILPSLLELGELAERFGLI